MYINTTKTTFYFNFWFYQAYKHHSYTRSSKPSLSLFTINSQFEKTRPLYYMHNLRTYDLIASRKVKKVWSEKFFMWLHFIARNSFNSRTVYNYSTVRSGRAGTHLVELVCEYWLSIGCPKNMGMQWRIGYLLCYELAL